MGYMTTLTILNDAFYEIEKDKESFFETLLNGMNRGVTGRNEYRGKVFGVYSFRGNALQIAPSFHADESHLFFVGQNGMYDLNCYYHINNERDIEIQLDTLKKARQIINFSEKELKAKLKEINQKSNEVN